MHRETESATGDYAKRERLFVQLFLLAVCLTLAHFVHSAWFFASQVNQGAPDLGLGMSYAPNAYRVMVPTLWHLFSHIFATTNLTWIAAALDFVFAYAALSLLYNLVIEGLSTQRDERRARLVIVSLFLAMLQFPMNWIVPWQRPETTPSALFLALALFCLARGRRGSAWSLLLLAATAFQSFVRADIPFLFGAALFLLSFAGKTLEDFGTRTSNVLKGAAVAAIAIAVQAYMQFVRYPHLTYGPDTQVIQLRINLQLHNLLSLALALLPFLLLAVVLIKTRIRLNSVEALTIAASVLYLPVWFTVGVVDEVRIFVPFLLALCVVAARVIGSCLLEAA